MLKIRIDVEKFKAAFIIKRKASTQYFNYRSFGIYPDEEKASYDRLLISTNPSGW